MNAQQAFKVATSDDITPLPKADRTGGKSAERARMERGYTQASLARACNVSLQTVQELEKGKSPPQGRVLNALQDKLGVSLSVKNFGKPKEKTAGSSKVDAKKQGKKK
jgi:transcriptional regulator with XRE-family HTH domain